MSQEMGIGLARTWQQSEATITRPRDDPYKKQRDVVEFTFKGGIPGPGVLCSWNQGPSGPAPTQETPNGAQRAPCGWVAVGSRSRPRAGGSHCCMRGASHGSLEHVSPLSPFSLPRTV